MFFSFLKDKYVYSDEELNAYSVPMKHRNKCVDLYVPFRQCVKNLFPLRALLDPKYNVQKTEYFLLILYNFVIFLNKKRRMLRRGSSLRALYEDPVKRALFLFI